MGKREIEVAKIVKISLKALTTGGKTLNPQERRVKTLQTQLGSDFSGWKALGAVEIAKNERNNRENMMKCQATHGLAWKLIEVGKGDLKRLVGYGFARKYLGLDYKAPK